MTKHSDTKNQLYDYAMNLLNDDARRNVEQHFSSCKSCTDDLKELQQAITLLPHPSTQPSDAKDEAFWNSVANNVERVIRLHTQPKPLFFSEVYEKMRTFFTFRPGYAYAIGGSLAAVVLAVVLFRWQPAEKQQVADAKSQTIDSTIVLTQYKNQERISQYFRKSKTLLVGIANMKMNDEQNIDLSVERKVSRELIHEARYLKQQAMDGRSARLVEDLEKILIELANLEETNDLPNVEMIRSGINQENLLFKIRMAEGSYNTNRTNSTEKIY